jgi:hypothetical protein
MNGATKMQNQWREAMVSLALAGLSVLSGNGTLACAQGVDPAAENHPAIASFSTDTSDAVTTYPTTVYLDLPDEHTTVIPIYPWRISWPGRPPRTPEYLVFGASRVSSTGPGGAAVLETSDLATFTTATDLGYPEQVMSSPVVITACDGTHDQEFDENYAAPGSVLEDPTRPPGNMIMVYEAENHCPGGVNQHYYYATVGFAVSSDGGQTWPAPVNSEFGDTTRRPVFKSSMAEPDTPSSTPLGNAIPSGFIDVDAQGNAYLYVVYEFHDGIAADESLRVGRAQLGQVFRGSLEGAIPYGDLDFEKWYNGSFSQPGIAGLDSSVLPAGGCTGQQMMGQITYNDDLGLYMLLFVCNTPTSAKAAWYYSAATSLELQNWTVPQMITNSEKSTTTPCNLNNSTGTSFDGFYPSFVSPGAAAGHTRLTGQVFFMDGCDTGARTFGSRGFTITLAAPG